MQKASTCRQNVGLFNVTGKQKSRFGYLRSRAKHVVVPKASYNSGSSSDGKELPLLVRAALGQTVERPPCWMMRQAGRYQKAYRDLAEKYPSFRQRSETTELIVETTLQPYNSFKPDGVILFSDILTPLPAMGIDFEIDDAKGPIIENTVTNMDQVNQLVPIEVDKLSFVGDSLSQLRKEISSDAALLGFVGAPWTLATYIIEGKSSTLYKQIKAMTYGEENQSVLNALLSHLASQIADYIRFQIESGADCIQIFDSWGGQLPAERWSQWSLPYIQRIIQSVKSTHPNTPLTLYVNGGGALLERMQKSGADVIGLDWYIDMKDARNRLGDTQPVQGNVDPVVLFASQQAIKEAVYDCVQKAGSGGGHILNLGHGVLVGTPEENVAYMFDLSKQMLYKEL